MKIAFIGQKGIPAQSGGIERHVEELSVKLAEQGHQVFVYSRPHYTNKALKIYRNIKLISMPSINSKGFDTILHTLISTLHALFQGYNIIHYHGVGPSTLSWIPRVFSRAKVISTLHCRDQFHQKWGWFARQYLKLGEWASCRFPHQTIVISQILKKFCFERFNKDVTYIPNGINQPAEIEQDIQKEILRKFNLEPSKYFLTVARLVRHKGIHYLIRAFNRIKTNKKLVIVGDSAHTDDYVVYLKNLAKNNPNIIFTGAQFDNDLHTLFKNAYLYIHPSESEGLPITVLEAMSHEKCVLVSNIPENIEAFAGRGFLFKNKDIDNLVKKMQILEQRSELRYEKAQLAKVHVLQNYNWDNIVKDTINLYEKTLHQREEFAFLLKN